MKRRGIEARHNTHCPAGIHLRRSATGIIAKLGGNLEAQELRNRLGREGAIGFVVGALALKA
jgi:hypothetical protein